MYICPVSSICNFIYFNNSKNFSGPTFQAVSISKNYAKGNSLEKSLLEYKKQLEKLQVSFVSEITNKTNELIKVKTKDTYTEIKNYIAEKKWYESWKMYHKRHQEEEKPFMQRLESYIIDMRKRESIEIEEQDVENNRILSERQKIKETMKEIEELYYGTAGVQRMITDDTYERTRALHLKNKGFDKIAGYESEKSILKEYFLSEIEKEKSGKDAHVPGSILYFGPTGMGKTTFYKAFAEESECRIGPKFRYDNMDDMNFLKEKFLPELYRKAQESEDYFKKNKIRTIFFIDEITRMTSDKSPILEELTDFIKNCSTKYHVTLFASTNSPEKIALDLKNDSEIFPFRVSLDPPSLENKAKLIEFYMKDRANSGFEYLELAKKIEEKEQSCDAVYSINQLKDICRRTGLVNANKTNDVTADDFLLQLTRIVPGISRAKLEKYLSDYNNLIQNEVLR